MSELPERRAYWLYSTDGARMLDRSVFYRWCLIEDVFYSWRTHVRYVRRPSPPEYFVLHDRPGEDFYWPPIRPDDSD